MALVNTIYTKNDGTTHKKPGGKFTSSVWVDKARNHGKLSTYMETIRGTQFLKNIQHGL